MSQAQIIIGRITDAIINPLIALLLALAVAIFLWGAVQFIASTESEEKRRTGRQHMIWGIVGLFIMVGVFGIIRILLNTFNIPLP